MKIIRNRVNGYTLVEVIISIAIFTVIMSSIIFGYSSIIRMEKIKSEKIYNSAKGIDEISKEYYIFKKD
jgi:prepilin-type N-terminal cleavage/methylation domain-containing protein